jgi:hypothetical protein
MERKVIKYIVVVQFGAKDLADKVNHYINMGWEPIGGLETTVDQYRTTFYQSLVKYSTHDTTRSKVH